MKNLNHDDGGGSCDGNGEGILRFKSRVQNWALIDKHASPFYSTNSVYETHGMAQFIGPLIHKSWWNWHEELIDHTTTILEK